MSNYWEADLEEMRSLAPAGGFGRYGGGNERHVVMLKIEEIDRTRPGSSVDQHVFKETLEEVDTVRDGSGIKQHVVKYQFEEVDNGGHHHHHQRHGHYGHGVDTGSHNHHHAHHSLGIHIGGHHHHHHAHHGHGIVVRETRVEEDFNSRTGEFHKRTETFLTRDD